MNVFLNGLALSLAASKFVFGREESSERCYSPAVIEEYLLDYARIRDGEIGISKECVNQLSTYTHDELNAFLEIYFLNGYNQVDSQAEDQDDRLAIRGVGNDINAESRRGTSGGGRGGGGSHGSSGHGSSGHGGGSSGHGSSGHEGGSSGGKGGSSGHEGGSSGGKGGSSGHEGGSSGGKGGSTGGKGGSAAGYGSAHRPDFSSEKGPPPPYSPGPNGPPPPYSPGTYGQRGPSPRYWNGQYYPYSTYGYGSALPFVGLGLAAPLLFAGPFGFYGHYCSGHRSENCTTNSIYVNGTMRNGSSSLYNGTYIESEWKDGQYTVRSMEGGEYKDGKNITDENQLYTAVNGTFIQPEGGSWNTKAINPNYTSDGSELKNPDDSDQSGESGGGQSNSGSSSSSSGASSLAMPPLIFAPIAVIGLLI